MRKKLTKFFLAIPFVIFLISCTFIPENSYTIPQIEWQKTFGSQDYDEAHSILLTNNGGIIFAGETSNDYWIVKLNENLNIEWQKILGGSYGDYAYSIDFSSDGGYIVAGYATSKDGSVTGTHGGTSDIWIIKLDIIGNVQWKRAFGGSEAEFTESIISTRDNGFIFAGSSFSEDGDATSLNHGYSDIWVVKLNENGDIVWQKLFGGSSDEDAFSIQQTDDNGYIVVGYTFSNDGDVTGKHELSDYWVLKLAEDGSLEWQKALGGSDYEEAYSVIQTNDGGFLITGFSFSNDGDVSGNHGEEDCWVVKLDENGNVQWQKSLGGSKSDFGRAALQTNDGGFIIAGYTKSDDGDVSENHGSADYWIIKLSENGNIEWQKTFGGSDYDKLYDIKLCNDGGIVMAGYTESNDGDITENQGNYDCWILKIK
ncbi:MAG: hypothetical protein PWP54_603 [Thermosipho sp. (in: thermotogales)]|nr:hypothetical protein [Thermosipho sp. (in: thermotogales)]MDN5324878.1 hypothetical protein [Thermosipho sp. (in: thermotogales)]